MAVLCGVDCETSPVYEVPCFLLGAAFLLHKVAHYSVEKRVLKVAHDFLRIAVIRGCLGNPVIDGIRHCFIALSRCDVTLLKHLVENDFPALGIIFRIFSRIVGRRILGDRGKDRRL